MFLNRVSISNFKVLRDAEIKFKPITILLGANNSGKSSLIQLLLAIKQTFESRNLTTPFVFEGPFVNLGTFEDVVFNHDKKNEIIVKLDFSRPDSEFLAILEKTRRISPIMGPFSLEFGIRYQIEKETTTLSRLKVSIQNNVILDIEKDELKRFLDMTFAVPIKIFNEKSSINIIKRHFLWKILLEQFSRPRLEIQLDSIYSIIEHFFSEFLFYLGPLRVYPERYYISSGERPYDLGLRGENVANFLYLDKEKLLDVINIWLNRFNISNDIIPEEVTKGIWKIILSDIETKIYSNIKDVGFGVSQLLPIIVLAYNAIEGAYLIIEQPEIHLHPKNQAELADLFIEMIKEKNYLIIETHSEHLLYRFARRIAEGKLKKEDIGVYEFDKSEQGTKIEEVHFDDFGNFEKWPAGFFEAELEDTLLQLKAIGMRKKDVDDSSN